MSQVGGKGGCVARLGTAHGGRQARGRTFEPFGVMFDSAEGRAVPQAAVDDGVDGQEICHRGGEEHPPCTGAGVSPGAGQGMAGQEPRTAPAVPPLTCEQGHVGVFGVIGTPGHATDVVPNRLQCVHLSQGRRGHKRCHADSRVQVTHTRRGVTRGGPRCPRPHVGGLTL